MAAFCLRPGPAGGKRPGRRPEHPAQLASQQGAAALQPAPGLERSGSAASIQQHRAGTPANPFLWQSPLCLGCIRLRPWQRSWRRRSTPCRRGGASPARDAAQLGAPAGHFQGAPGHALPPGSEGGTAPPGAPRAVRAVRGVRPLGRAGERALRTSWRALVPSLPSAGAASGLAACLPLLSVLLLTQCSKTC